MTSQTAKNITRQVGEHLKISQKKQLDTQQQQENLTRYTELESDVASALLAQDITLAIHKLDELSQLKRNHHLTLLENADSPDLLIRDTRGTSTILRNGYEPYAIKSLHALRVALSLLDNHASDNEKDVLLTLAQLFFKEIRKTEKYAGLSKKSALEKKILAQAGKRHYPEEISKRFNTHVVNIVASILKISGKEAAIRMNERKDYLNMDEASKTITTILEVQDPDTKETKTYSLSANPLLQLTEKMDNEYSNKRGKRWYAEQSKTKKANIDIYGNKILAGSAVKPTQLREMPGLRNAYHFTIANTDNAENPIVLGEHYQHGALPTLLKTPALQRKEGENDNDYAARKKEKKKHTDEENIRLTVLNAEQLQKNIEAIEDKSIKISFTSLNAEGNTFNNDANIVHYSAEAMKQLDFDHSNLCVNAFRRYTSDKHDGIKEQLGAVAKFFPIQGRFEKIRTYISSPSDLNKNPSLFQRIKKRTKKIIRLNKTAEQLYRIQLKGILNVLDKEYANKEKDGVYKLLYAAVMCRFHMNINRGFDSKHNHNLFIAAYQYIVNHELKSLVEKPTIASAACQSGKDRLGLVLSTLTALQIYYDFKGKFPQKSNHLFQNILDKVACSHHFQTLAGTQGGSYGCNGIKKDTKAAIPHDYPENFIKQIILPQAANNKKIDYYKKSDMHCYYLPELKGLAATDPQKFLTIAFYDLSSCLKRRIRKNHERHTRSKQLNPIKRLFFRLFNNDTLSQEREKLLTNTLADIQEKINNHDINNAWDLGKATNALWKENRTLTKTHHKWYQFSRKGGTNRTLEQARGFFYNLSCELEQDHPKRRTVESSEKTLSS